MRGPDLGASAGNSAVKKILFYQDMRLKKELAAAAPGQNFITEAPIAVVCCADSEHRPALWRAGTGLYLSRTFQQASSA